jgi:DNA-binding transcriptional LysR family regulator
MSAASLLLALGIGDEQPERQKWTDRNVLEVAVNGPYIANDFPTLLGAAAEGIGLAQLPEPIAARSVAEGKLLRVLEPFAPLAPGVFLFHPGRHQVMPKLRAFIDHVKARAGARRFKS